MEKNDKKSIEEKCQEAFTKISKDIIHDFDNYCTRMLNALPLTKYDESYLDRVVPLILHHWEDLITTEERKLLCQNRDISVKMNSDIQALEYEQELILKNVEEIKDWFYQNGYPLYQNVDAPESTSKHIISFEGVDDRDIPTDNDENIATRVS